MPLTLIAWYVLACAYLFAALYYLSGTYAIRRAIQKNPAADVSDQPSYEMAFLMLVYIVLLNPILRNVSQREARLVSEPLWWKLQRKPIAVCVSCWILVVLCVVISKKMVSRLSWRDYMERKLQVLFYALDDARALLENLGKWERNLNPYIKFISVLIWTMAAGIIVVNFFDTPVVVALFAVITFFLQFLLKVYQAMHSCRKFLMFWLGYGVLLSAVVGSLMPSLWEGALVYVSFTAVLSVIWLVSAGVADDDVAIMGCTIVNTATTILIITINVIAVWGEMSVPSYRQWKLPWSEMQTFSVFLLLPLVMGGYLVALLKQAQKYWWDKHKRSGKQ